MPIARQPTTFTRKIPSGKPAPNLRLDDLVGEVAKEGTDSAADGDRQ